MKLYFSCFKYLKTHEICCQRFDKILRLESDYIILVLVTFLYYKLSPSLFIKKIDLSPQIE